jgi:hypothetical protein
MRYLSQPCSQEGQSTFAKKAVPKMSTVTNLHCALHQEIETSSGRIASQDAEPEGTVVDGIYFSRTFGDETQVNPKPAKMSSYI